MLRLRLKVREEIVFNRKKIRAKTTDVVEFIEEKAGRAIIKLLFGITKSGLRLGDISRSMD